MLAHQSHRPARAVVAEVAHPTHPHLIKVVGMASGVGPASGRGAIRVLAVAICVSVVAIAVLTAGVVLNWPRMDAVGVLAGVWGLVALALFALVPLFRKEDRELHGDLHPVFPIDPIEVTAPQPWPVSSVAAALAFRLEDTPYQITADHQLIAVAGGPVTFDLRGPGRRVTRSFRLTLRAGRDGEFEQVCHDHSRYQVPGERTFRVRRAGQPPDRMTGAGEIGDLMSTRHLMGPLHHALAESGWRTTPRRRVLNWIYPAVAAVVSVIAAIPIVLANVL